MKDVFVSLKLAVLQLMIASSVQAAAIECLSKWEKPSAPAGQAYVQGLFPPGFSPFGLCETAGITGRIEKGDHAAFLDLYRRSRHALEEVVLISPGGDVREAMAIGQTLRKYLLEARAPSVRGSVGSMRARKPPRQTICSGRDCVCASACALVWFGAVEREGHVGLHRPVIEDVSFPLMAPDAASKAYRQVLGEIKQYMTKMEAPAHLIELMISTDSSEVAWTGRSFKESLSLAEPPSIAEFANSSCGSITKSETTTLADLWHARGIGRRLTPKEKTLFENLLGKYTDRLDCFEALMRLHRHKMILP